ncbi:MAG: hypothetical protein QNJ55_21095 [Xenococcus sp. MO_188.B8]|nr:hypothetical protein [Xenococcus sp. MO_188.B8]
MTDTAFQIKNPSVTLYAFHLCQDLSQKPGQLRQDADRLWQNCANLSEPLAIPDLKSLPEKLQSPPTQTPITSRYVELLPGNGRLTYTPPLQIEGSALTVEVYPVQIHDIYAFDLTLYYENVTVSASQFSHLNPQGCLLASNIRASLEQTLVLYAEPVGSPEEDTKLADACVDAFLQGSNQQRPARIESAQLFGSPIFEYDNGQEKPSEQCHILVWFNRNSETLNRVQKTYFSFFNLLCCRSKILFAYHEARWCYHQTRQLYAELEQEVISLGLLEKELPKQLVAQLQYFKKKLIQIPTKSFNYTRYLRDIKDCKTAITTNAKNYDYWLGKIRESSLESDDLEFLANFLNQRSPRFQDQIEVDLSFFISGQQLFEQIREAIQPMLKIIEIEQAESARAFAEALRKKDEAAEEREKRLRLWIALVGTGLAVSGISAQTDAKPIETLLSDRLKPNQTLDCPDAGRDLCLEYYSAYIMFHVGIGVLAASILGFIIWLGSTISALLTSKSKRSSH